MATEENDKTKTLNDKQELIKAAFLGSSYVGSEETTFKEVGVRYKKLWNDLIGPFGHGGSSGHGDDESPPGFAL